MIFMTDSIFLSGAVRLLIHGNGSLPAGPGRERSDLMCRGIVAYHLIRPLHQGWACDQDVLAAPWLSAALGCGPGAEVTRSVYRSRGVPK